MKAGLVFHEKKYFTDGSLQEIKIWKVPESKDKPHGLKYSFVYIVNDERIIGYDNAEGKGDHRHYKREIYPYKFQGLDKLWSDFKQDIRNLRRTNRES